MSPERGNGEAVFRPKARRRVKISTIIHCFSQVMLPDSSKPVFDNPGTGQFDKWARTPPLPVMGLPV